jgi:hypothetical protein
MNTTLYYHSQGDGTKGNLISNLTDKFLVDGNLNQKPNITQVPIH